MLFKSYILACIKLMINACTIMVNLRLNVSLRRLATSKYNILFFFLLVAKQPWRMKLWGRLKTLKKNLYFKTILFKASRQTFLSQKIIPVKTVCTGRRRYLRDFKNSRICGVACIAYTQIKDSFLHTILNQEVHNILETEFHKNFTCKKKKSCTKYYSSSQNFP